MKFNAFTLAEVLITLVIIGVIAAMTIPTLMGSTDKREITTARNKALSASGQALGLEYSLYGNQANGDEGYLAQMLKNHLSVIEEDEEWGGLAFTTADGMKYYVDDGYSFWVDVNGERKGPNTANEDLFQFFVEGRKVYYPEETAMNEEENGGASGSGSSSGSSDPSNDPTTPSPTSDLVPTTTPTDPTMVGPTMGSDYDIPGPTIPTMDTTPTTPGATDYDPNYPNPTYYNPAPTQPDPYILPDPTQEPAGTNVVPYSGSNNGSNSGSNDEIDDD